MNETRFIIVRSSGISSLVSRWSKEELLAGVGRSGHEEPGGARRCQQGKIRSQEKLQGAKMEPGHAKGGQQEPGGRGQTKQSRELCVQLTIELSTPCWLKLREEANTKGTRKMWPPLAFMASMAFPDLPGPSIGTAPDLSLLSPILS